MTKGYKTSEFWLTAIGSLLTILNQSGLIGAPLPTESIMTVGGVLASYVASRGVAKINRQK